MKQIYAQKLVSFVLIFTFLISPFSTVFAEEATTPALDATASNTATTQPKTLPTQKLDTSELEQAIQGLKSDTKNKLNTSVTQTDSNASTNEDQNENKIIDPPMDSLSAPSDPPSAANPTFTYQTIAPKIEKTTGALVQSIPIAVPKGRNSVQPNIALTYNSQNLEDSIVGYGWNINIPYIERINRRGTNNLYSDSYFNSSISGELGTTTTYNEYKPKVEETDSLKYTFSTTTTGGNWIAYDKSGTKYTFGTTTSARVEDGSDSSKVFKWMLVEIRDTNNNFIRFEYYKDAGQIYPYKIYYTGSGSTDGIFLVEFSRESRGDVITSYKTGFLVQTNYRINQIQSKVNGTWVHQYALAYTTGSNTKRSLLQSVTESAQDEAGTGTTSLPAVTFEYINDPIAYHYNTITMQGINSPAWILADVDGNGLLDPSMSYWNSYADLNHIFNYFALNKGDQNPTDITVYNPPYFNEYWGYDGYGTRPVENGVRFFDINGDGLADVVHSDYSSITGFYNNKIYLNDGLYASTSILSWTGATTSVPTFSISGQYGSETQGFLANLNGDGLTDFKRALSYGTNTSYFGKGYEFDSSTTTFTPKAFIPFGSVDTAASQLVDINGDGLDDWVYNTGGEIKTCLNTGLDWQSSCTNGYTYASTTVDSYGYDKGFRFVDINGDGLLDLIRSYRMDPYIYSNGTYPEIGSSSFVLYNTGSGWATSTVTLPGTVVTGDASGGYFTGNFFKSEMWDWSGDGLADWKDYKNTARKPDMLKKVTYATGGSTDIAYSPTTAQMRNNVPKHVNLPMVVYTVASTSNNDANGNSEVTNYTYENGDLYFNGPYDRKFAGFENIIETRPEAIITTYYYQGNNASTTVGELSDDVSKIGKVYREDVTDPATGSLIKRTFYNWDSSSRSNNRYFVRLTRTLEQIYDGNSTHKDRGSTIIYDSNGNAIQKNDFGEVSGNTDGTFSDTGSDLASTTISYAASSTVNMFVPYQVTTLDQSATKVKETRNYYDSLSLGSATKGNLTKQESWITSSSYASTTKTYNSYGLVNQDTDPRGKNTAYTYDAYNLYVATSTNPLSQTTAYTYDYSSGQVKQTVDPNGRVFQNVFDGFDRLTESKQPDQTTPTTLVTKSQFTYTDNTVPTKVQETNYLNNATSTDKYTYFDGLGRKIQERLEAEGTNTYAIKDYVYNSTGKLLKESLPYFASSTANASSTNTSALYNVYGYDALGRVKTIANAVGTTTTTYDDWHTTVTDALGHPKDFYKDAYDNLTVVAEHNGSTHATTTYTYDLNKNLTSITDGSANVRSFTYNGLNQRLTAQDLHASGDGTYGSYSYTYDAAGNMTQKVDPKSQTINYTYDDVNRPLTEDYTGTGGTEVTYTYDSGTDGKGKLATASSTAELSAFTYNPLGLLKTESKTIGGVGYTTQYTYDRLGNQTNIVYPDSSEVNYGYNAAGLLETIAQKESGGSFANLVNNFDYAPTGKMTFKDLANGVQTRYTYNPSVLYRLTNISTVSTASGMGGSLEEPLLGDLTDEEIASTTKLLEEKLQDEIAEEETSTTTEQASEKEIATTYKEATSTEQIIVTENATSTEATSTETLLTEEIASSTPVASSTTESVATSDTQKPTEKITPDESKVTIEKALESGMTIELAKDHPEIHLKKEGKLDFGITYGIVKATSSREENSKITKWKDIDQEVHAYPVAIQDMPAKPDEKANEKGSTDEGFEVEVVLNKKPDTKVFTFGVTGAENLDFLYQPALNTETLPEEADHCTETQCFDKDGKSIAQRPENVVGSYAVYYKGGDHGTGKAFHIYRPKAVDSTGKEVWGTLAYANNALTVEIPEEFLKSATYPVTVDPTFGYSTVGASQNYWTGYINSTKFTTTEAGTASSMSLRVNDAGSVGPAKIVMGIYDASFNKIEQTVEGTITNGYNNWITLNLNNPVSLANATDYWLAFRTEVGLYKKYDSGSTNQTSLTYIGAYNSTLASSISSGSQSEKPSIYATYATTSSNTAPTAPSSLLTEGATNPTAVIDITPEFSAIFNDADTGDAATSYQIQVSTTTAFTSTLWDSGKTTLGSTTPKNTRIADISYAGSSLTASTTYYWRIKFWDLGDSVGAWSTTTSSFILSVGAGNYVANVQNISYTYDAVGNITQIADSSNTGLAKAVTYVYDSLNRLTSASTTAATSTPYKYSYAYDVLGNITSQTIGTTTTNRTYAGTGYANPHAPTTIGSTNYTYDNNGNTTYAGSLGYTWDYRNRISAATNTSGVSTTTYAYDFKDGRVKSVVGGVTTLYPNKYYQLAGATSTKYIFDTAGELVATIESTSVGTTTIESNVYTDSQQDSWTNNWSWSSNTSYSSTYNVYSGTNAIANTYTGTYGGFFIDRTSALDRSPYTDIRFAVNVGTTTGMALTLELYDQYDHRIATKDLSTYFPGGTPAGSTWYSLSVPLSNFATSSSYVKGIAITNTTSTGTIYIDNIRFAKDTVGGGGGTGVNFVHPDHLGSSNDITDATGATVQSLDYYPYGSVRLNTGSTNINRQYIGERYDANAGLNYLNARYLDSTRGQFLSEDPVFWEVGQSEDGKIVLTNPQAQNSYGYGNENPITGKDPMGRLNLETYTKHPYVSLWNSAWWDIGSIATRLTGRDLTSSLLNHSTNLEPKDITINNENQSKYGNPINKIKQSNEYQNFLEESFENAKKGNDTTSGSIEFTSGDLYTSLHKVNITISIQNENQDSSMINTTISDYYDFNPTNPQTYKGTLTRLPATHAYQAQQKGYLSNYGINIKFSQEINNDKKK